MFQRIFLPLESADGLTGSLERVVDFALEQHAALRLAHVVNDSLLVANVEGYAQVTIEGLRNDGQALLDEALACIRPRLPAADSVLLEASSHRLPEELVAAAHAWQADLMVMLTHGRHGLDHFFFGSVTEAVLRHSGLPMLLLHL